MNRKYVHNLENGKIELHFTKEEYSSLPEDFKKELKRNYLFSSAIPAWVSRSKNNHYWAIQVANKLGFTEEERKGERLSYEEELNRKAEKAERRAERYDGYADNAITRAENLQSELNKFRGDTAFFTQPIIRGHKGSEAFGKRREAIMNRYNKGFEEYRKSDYFKEKAEIAQRTADKEQLKSKTYLCNRIKECKSSIKKLERYIVAAEQRGNNEAIEDYLSKLEYQIDKQAFLENCLEQLGGIYSKENIKPGYLIEHFGWAKVKKVNDKTVLAEYLEHPLAGQESKIEYSKINKIKIPENYTESKNELENPFKLNDLVVSYNASGNRVIEAYQVIKTTPKTVIIQEIEIKGNRPVLNSFKVGSKKERKTVKEDRTGNIVLNNDNWYLYKWEDKNQNQLQDVI